MLYFPQLLGVILLKGWHVMKIALLSTMMVLLAVVLSPVSAQSDIRLKVKAMRRFEEVVGEGANPRIAALSPDGTMIARLEKDSICLFTFADGADRCTVWPDLLKSPTTLYWSPDSQAIAMHENVFQYFRDSDIWLFDTRTKTFSHPTDDNYYGDVLKMDETVFLDYLPTWNPVTNKLYFFRSQKRPASERIGYSLGLYSLSPEGGKPAQVGEYINDLPGPFSVFETTYITLDGASAIAPDGKQMAVLVRPREQDDPASGIYVLDLSGKAKPKQVVSSANGFAQGVPSWQKPLPIATGLSWTADGKGLVFTAEDVSGTIRGVTRMLYHVDLATQKITPLLDFSSVKDAASFYKVDEEGNSPMLRVPMSAVYLPSQNLVLTYSGLPVTGKASIMALRLPSYQGQPVTLHTIETSGVIPMYTVSVSRDEKKVLMFGYLVEFE
jgi:hypothetical protein